MMFEKEVTLKSLIRQFEHGFKALSRSNLISSSGFHISVAGLLGIAGFVLALKDSKLSRLSSLDWLPKTDNGSPKLRLVPGLQNLGNNCFLNVILQALASCSYFQPFLQKVLEEYEFSAVEDEVSGFPLAIALAALLEDLRVVGGGRVVLSPRRVMLAMAHYIQNFDLTSQQISLNLESFHSLPLSPVLDGGETIMVGCNLEDCLKQFTIAERVENYHCNHCWHIAAVKYLFARGVNEADIEKIKRCTEQDSCDCRRLFHLDKLPWSNKFSCTLKQISVARCPKILCIHLKRVSINVFGELVKLQGCISFPLVLDLSQFTTSGSEINSWEDNMRRGQAQGQSRNPSTRSNQFTMQYDQRKHNNVYGLTRGGISEELASDISRFAANAQDLPGESSFPQTAGFSKTMHSGGDQWSKSCEDPCLYHLVAVVEHFGRAGSGHYTVYRSVRADLCEEESDDQFEAAAPCWFSISDSEVCRVSKEAVLAAEASLLFYEKNEG
ncbi:ubiquitin carboxyl-terminal hydrolase 27 isoform X2 [Prunus dulcis]|uniref:ubiquitin carboxyl-terminal hydrolase 27 isoform X2 n=1 Tax=Prunus dulcis TaxID=3755 RepID=UPI00148201EB|nr:ubiquitin carboxyl-terminal hydrolase 27 isoform X2 [Prunus dulcis]